MVVVLVLAFVVVAVAKPWVGTAPVPPPAPLVTAPAASTAPSVSQLPTAAPLPSLAPATPPGSPPPAGITAADWSALGASVQPHDAWGIRTLVLRPDGSVREEWTPTYPSEEQLVFAPAYADSYNWIKTNGTIVALGVTTPLADLPLDVRAWRMATGAGGNLSGWRNLAVMGSTPSGDPSSRVLRLPEDWSDGNAWPAGQYQLDVLLEGGVTHVHLWLNGTNGNMPPPPAPRAAPPISQLRAIAGTPGAFIVSGNATVSYLFSGLPPSASQHDEFDSWLALRSNNIFWAPGLYEPPAPVVNTANLLGAALPPGQRFRSAELMEIAPVVADLGPAQIVSGLDGAVERPAALALFRPADPAAGFASQVYRIDGVVQTKRGPVDMSWDLPVVARSSTTESLLLAADRAWPNLPSGGWTVLSPGHRVRVVPAVSGNLMDVPGTGCSGGADVGVAPWYVGVAHPGANFDSVVVWQLSDANFPTQVATQVSQLLGGFATIRPIAGDWLPGRYAIVMRSQAKSQSVTMCVQ